MMDCRTAQATLDAGRPDRSDWGAPELCAAAAHVEECPDCQVALEERSTWDELLAEALGDVVLPRGLEARLLAAVATEPSRIPSAADRGRPTRRRRWYWGAAAIAAVLMAALALRQLPWGDAPQLGLNNVFALVLAELPAPQEVSLTDLPAAFDGSFSPVVQDAVWRDALAASPPVGIDLDGRAGQDAAAYRFAAGRISGWLVVMPRSRVANPPEATVPLHQNSRYAPRPHVAWSRGKQLYVCVLDRGSLDDLQREFYGAAA